MKKNIFCFALMILLTATAVHAQDNWTLKNPPTSPPKLTNSAMAYIGGDHVLQFGGVDGGYNQPDATWAYDLSDNNWTLKNPPISPSGRSQHAMAYIGDDKVLMYGVGTETWVYDLSDNIWTLKNPATNPGLTAPAMARIGDDKVLLYGVLTTWVYDLSDNTWTEKIPATTPSVYLGVRMSSIGDDKAVLFGGFANQDVNNETWVYDLSDNNWTLQNPAINPEARFYHHMAALGGDQVLLFGGVPNGIPFGDTWVYKLSDASWTLKNPLLAPPPQGFSTMANIGNNKVLFVGGAEPDYMNQTWLYTGSASSCSMTVSAGADENLYFGYAADQCVIKTATVTDGTSPFTYSWTLSRALLPGESMTGSATASVTVCLLDTAELCVTVTDAAGCTANDCAMIFAEDVRCSAGNSSNQKVKVCHNGNTICVESSAVNAHIGHGDYVGKCTGNVSAQSEFNIEDNTKQGFTIYPNPAKGDFTITMNLTDEYAGEKIIQVINISGQVVKKIYAKDQNKLNLTIHEPGVYFIKLEAGKKIITKKLIVIN